MIGRTETSRKNQKFLNTSAMSECLRMKCIGQINKRIFISKYDDSKQCQDLTVPANCQNLCRIHYFKKALVIDGQTTRFPLNLHVKHLV